MSDSITHVGNTLFVCVCYYHFLNLGMGVRHVYPDIKINIFNIVASQTVAHSRMRHRLIM